MEAFHFARAGRSNRPTSCFCRASKLRMVFTFFLTIEKSKDKYFLVSKNDRKVNFSVYKSSFFGTQ